MEAHEISVEARRTVHGAGVADLSAYRVTAGIIALFRSGESGKVHHPALRYPGELIEPDELRVGYGVMALTRSVVEKMSLSQFQAIEQSEEGSDFLKASRARHLRIALEWISRSSSNSAGRLAHLWCETHARLGENSITFQVPFTQQQMADITGQTTVNVNRVIRDWRDRSITRGSGEAFEVEWTELATIGRFDPAYLRER